MKRILIILLTITLLVPFLSGCAQKTASGEPKGNVYDDGRARPSSCGRLKVVDGKLCSESGEPVMLRGVSTNDLMISESFINDELFRELSEEKGVNAVRLAVYTYGVGIIGYCTSGDRERYEKDVEKGVELAVRHDMYVIIDWHVLSEGDPNVYIEDSLHFFEKTAEKFSGCKNVLYEICNEPNGVEWSEVKRYAECVIPVIRDKAPDSVIIVGDPDWSKDLLSCAEDPLEFGNVMYALHFYSASHGRSYREVTEEASEKGLPIFVTEFGVTASTGDLPRDLESADEWIELLERENISYCMWSLAKAPEACSMIRSYVTKYSGFETEDYSESGIWLIETIKKHGSM